MLSDVLNRLKDKGQATAHQLGILAEVSSVQTIYNWLAEKGNPAEVALKGWLSPNAPQALQEATLRELTDGRASFTNPKSEDEPNLDFNGDGKVNLSDAMAATMQYENAAHRTLKLVYDAYERDPESISSNTWQMLIDNNEKAIGYMRAIDRICSERVSRRRQAKEVFCAVH